MKSSCSEHQLFRFVYLLNIAMHGEDGSIRRHHVHINLSAWFWLYPAPPVAKTVRPPPLRQLLFIRPRPEHYQRRCAKMSYKDQFSPWVFAFVFAVFHWSYAEAL